MVHQAMALTQSQPAPGKAGDHCIWCGSTTCTFLTNNQCKLVYTNRAGVTMLATRKFGLLKQTSNTAFEAAFKEASELGALKGAAAKDIEEFRNLVDQSVQYYDARDEQYQLTRAQSNNTPYTPARQYSTQDVKQPGGYQNGSNYPPSSFSMGNRGGNSGRPHTSPYAAYPRTF